MSKSKTVPAPWLPAPYQPVDTAALHALEAGNASPGQQQRALAWIINVLCGTYDLSYRPGEGGDRETAFAEGKRHVGLQIVKQLKIPAALQRQQPMRTE